MLSDRVFQSILPLNDRELCPYEEVFTFGIWSRFFIFFLMTKYRSLANKKIKIILEIQPRDFLKIFLRFRPFEPHFHTNLFLIKTGYIT